MLGLLSSRKSIAPDQVDCLAKLKARIEGTNIESLLRAGGETGIGPGPGLSDEYLLRYLRAEVFDVNKTFERLQFQSKWRSDYVPTGFISEDEVRPEIEDGKCFALEKCTKDGRPVTIVFAARHLRRKGRDMAIHKRSCVYFMDILGMMATASGGDGNICGIYDLRGCGMDNLDLAVGKQLVQTLTTHYPERLGEVFIVSIPALWVTFWKALSIFLPESTKGKIHFVADLESAKNLHPTLLEILPEPYGGTNRVVDFPELAAKLGYGGQTPPSAGLCYAKPVDDDSASDETEFWDAEMDKMAEEAAGLIAEEPLQNADLLLRAR
eukprot:jgi/Botrbrau1/225/Bobra.0022s0204.1